MAKEAETAAPTEEKADETAALPTAKDEPGIGDIAPIAGQPVATTAVQQVLSPLEDHLAEQRCVLVEAVNDNPMANPALAGVAPKPRCKHCRTLLADGRCVEPECGKEQVDA